MHSCHGAKALDHGRLTEAPGKIPGDLHSSACAPNGIQQTMVDTRTVQNLMHKVKIYNIHIHEYKLFVSRRACPTAHIDACTHVAERIARDQKSRKEGCGWFTPSGPPGTPGSPRPARRDQTAQQAPQSLPRGRDEPRGIGGALTWILKGHSAALWPTRPHEYQVP